MLTQHSDSKGQGKAPGSGSRRASSIGSGTRLTSEPICQWIKLFSGPEQVQVGGKKTNIVLQQLQPDTPYTVTVAAVYPSGISRDISGEGKTSKNNDRSWSCSWNTPNEPIQL